MQSGALNANALLPSTAPQAIPSFARRRLE
jgi:hypothetical protein